MDIDEIVQGKLDGDTDFQASIADLSDDEKNTAIATKRAELVRSEYQATAEARVAAERIAGDQKTRAVKAETELEKFKPKPGETNDKDLSTDDVLILVGAQITHSEDIAEVKKAAKLLGISISEAIKDSTVQSILETRQEERKTREAANTTTARPGNVKKSASEILADASKGVLPEKGSQDAEALFWARRGGKR